MNVFLVHAIIGVTTVQKVGGRSEARRAESGGGVLGEGAASPLGEGAASPLGEGAASPLPTS